MKFRRFSLLLHIVNEIKFPVTSILALVGLGTYLFHYYELPYYQANGETLTYGTSFYYVIVVLTTIGFGDVVAHTPEGRIVTVSLIILGIGLLSLAFNSITQRIVRSAVDLEFQYQRVVKGYSDHIVLVGYSEVGQRIAKLLSSWKLEIVIIDKKPDRVSQARQDGYTTLTGDVTTIRELERTGIVSAIGLVLAVEDPNVTLFTAKAARVVKGEQDPFWVISQSSSSVSKQLYKSAEIDYAVDMFEVTRKRMFGILTGVNIDKLEFSMPDGIGFYRIPNFATAHTFNSEGMNKFHELLLKHNVTVLGQIAGEYFNPELDGDLSIGNVDELLIAGRQLDLNQLSFDLEREFIQEDRDKRLIIAGYGNFAKSIIETAFNYADEVLVLDLSPIALDNAQSDFERIQRTQIANSLQTIKDIEHEIALMKSSRLQKEIRSRVNELVNTQEIAILQTIIKDDVCAIKELEEKLKIMSARQSIEIDSITEGKNFVVDMLEEMNTSRISLEYIEKQIKRLKLKVQIAELNIAKHQKKDTATIKKLNQKIKKLGNAEEISFNTEVLTREISYLLLKFIKGKKLKTAKKYTKLSKGTNVESLRKTKLEHLILKLNFENIHLDRVRNTVLRGATNPSFEDLINVDKLILTSQSAGTMTALALRALEVNPDVEIFARATDANHVKIFHSISSNIMVLSPEVSCASQLSSGVLQEVFNSKIVLFSNGQLLFSAGGNTFSNFSLLKKKTSLASFRVKPVGLLRRVVKFWSKPEGERSTYFWIGAREKQNDWELKFAEF